MNTDWDVVIVGGGSAGCVLAARLSEDAGTRVLLLEAGRDTPPDAVEPAILDSYPRIAYFNPRNIWGDLRVHLTPVPHNNPAAAGPPRRYEQARLMGGGSSLNDMQANRGIPDDYDEWERMGAQGWGWSAVLPYFRKLERDIDFGGPMHGKDGPITVRRIMPEAWPGFSRAAAQAFSDAGYPWIEDQNASFGDGHFAVAISNYLDRRVSSAIGYLDNATRRRPNLRIRPHSVVTGLVMEGTRVTGLRLRAEGGGEERISAARVIVSAGALHSPALLMRAGIGPGAELAKLGIPVIADRRGVGGNLMEHPAISISAYLRPEARLPDTMRRHIHVGLRWTSGLPDCPPQDMYMVAMCKTGWHPIGQRIGGLMTWVNKSYSRGRVRLAAADPATEPHVEFAMGGDARDVARLKHGMRTIARLYDHPAMAAAVTDPFPTSYSERIRDLGIVSRSNWVKTALLSAAMDSSAWLRSRLVERVVTEGATLTGLLADDDLLEAFVREKVHGIWHASGTCRMGDPADPDAVTQADGAVIGVEGLHVCDTSLMPAVPRANTNKPVMMIAEKIADTLRGRRTA